jgi:hypothetical protein
MREVEQLHSNYLKGKTLRSALRASMADAYLVLAIEGQDVFIDLNLSRR